MNAVTGGAGGYARTLVGHWLIVVGAAEFGLGMMVFASGVAQDTAGGRGGIGRGGVESDIMVAYWDFEPVALGWGAFLLALGCVTLVRASRKS